MRRSKRAGGFAIVACYGGWAAYFMFAPVQFFRGERFFTACKAVGAAALSQALTLGIFFVFIVKFSRIAES